MNLLIDKSVEIDNCQYEKKKKKNVYSKSVTHHKQNYKQEIYSIKIKLNTIVKTRHKKIQKFKNKFKMTCYKYDKKNIINETVKIHNSTSHEIK